MFSDDSFKKKCVSVYLYISVYTCTCRVGGGELNNDSVFVYPLRFIPTLLAKALMGLSKAVPYLSNNVCRKPLAICHKSRKLCPISRASVCPYIG